MCTYMRYCDAVEMQARVERLYEVTQKIQRLEVALLELTSSGVDATNEEEHRRIFIELEMAKNELCAVTHTLYSGRGQISGYGKLL